MPVTSFLQIDGLTKNYQTPDELGLLPVLKNVSMHAGAGEFISVIGPSGCGKSTLLNLIAGFETADTGIICLDHVKIHSVTPEVAMIFQASALFPWLTVRDNISYGLKRRLANKKMIIERTRQFITLMGLEGFEHYYPEQLSGGMQQRVALGRALILEPKLLLMDEPFASLDAQSRMMMQQVLLTLWLEYKPTIIFVTHDVDEAILLADRVYVMSRRPGCISQELIIPFARPRTSANIHSSGFMAIKDNIMRQLFTQDFK